MKSILYQAYGSPDVLRLVDTEIPLPQASEVLIAVAAASVNPLDWHFLRGQPYLMRAFTGVAKPKDTRLGVDVAGTVAAVGTGVTQFKVGDRVLGIARAAFADFACAQEKNLAAMPSNLDFQQAASVPLAALTALQGLRDAGRIQAGQRVLINGAAGGVGTFAVQIAKAFGAHVSAVCSTRNVAMVYRCGADRVLDYRDANFTLGVQRFDLILDCVGNDTLSACKKALSPIGRLVLVGGPDGKWLEPITRALQAKCFFAFSRQSVTPLLTSLAQSRSDLVQLTALIQAAQLKPVLDRSYPLRATADALRYLETRRAQGKVTINILT